MKEKIFDGQVSSMLRFKLKTQSEEEVRYIMIGGRPKIPMIYLLRIFRLDNTKTVSRLPFGITEHGDRTPIKM